jgi:hypothetical protein
VFWTSRPVVRGRLLEPPISQRGGRTLADVLAKTKAMANRTMPTTMSAVSGKISSGDTRMAIAPPKRAARPVEPIPRLAFLRRSDARCLASARSLGPGRLGPTDPHSACRYLMAAPAGTRRKRFYRRRDCRRADGQKARPPLNARRSR